MSYFKIHAPGENSNRWLSPDLWDFGKNGPSAIDRYMMGDMTVGYGFVDDFRDLATGLYTTTQAGSAGTFALLDTGVYGYAELDSASGTVTQGANVQRKGQKFARKTGSTVWCETMLRFLDIATGPEFFFGLHIIDTAIIASSAMAAADSDWAGFKSVTDNNIVLATTSDNATETTAASIHTFLDGVSVTDGTEWVKLGLRLEDDVAEFFVDGVKVASITTTLPTANTILVPSLVCQSNGSTDPLAHIDFLAAFSNDRGVRTIA